MSKVLINDVKRWLQSEKYIDNRVVIKRFDIFNCSHESVKDAIEYVKNEYGERVVLMTDFRDESLEIKILAKEEEE